MPVVTRSAETFSEAIARQLLKTLEAKPRHQQPATLDFHDVLKKLVLDQPRIDHVHDASGPDRTADAATPASAQQARHANATSTMK